MCTFSVPGELKEMSGFLSLSLSLSLSRIFVSGGSAHSDGPIVLATIILIQLLVVGGIELYQCGILHMNIRVPSSRVKILIILGTHLTACTS